MKIVLPFLALAALAPAQEIIVNKQTSNERQGTMAYSRSREFTFSGRVTGKLKADGVNGPVAPVRILVKTKKGTTNVDLGPTWYLRDQIATVNVGDQVTVTGSAFKINGMNVVNARVIKKGGKRLVLRDTQGYPYWVAKRQTAPARPTSGGIEGRIARLENYTINGQVFNGAVVTTDQGERFVAFAPDWYYGQQNIQLAPGALISAFGGAYSPTGGLQSPAPGLFIVNSLYTPNGYYGFYNPSGYVYGNFPGFPGR
ncbi:hypothetical protein BH11ARM2_BH11ARM2_12990 [soil metagenome]